MQLDEFFDYKNRLMDDLLTSKRIITLLSDDCKTIRSPESLVYSQVFPYEYIPETVTHGHTFICCEVEIQRVSSKTYLTPALYVWVFTHKSKIRLPEGGVEQTSCVLRLQRQSMGAGSTDSVNLICIL